MSQPLPQDADSLAALRGEIDAIDESIHRALMRRAEIIERLIAAKRLGNADSAFRPDREASMLRQLAARHEGALPLATVEHVWREIIGAFTQLQAPFRVHATRAGEPAMRDLLRFHFGFAAPLVEQASPASVIAAIKGGGDLGVVALDGASASGWWADLSTGPGGVKVIAALPFMSRPDSAWPRALVIGPASIAGEAPDIVVYAAQIDGSATVGPRESGAEILAIAGPSALLTAPNKANAAALLAQDGLSLNRAVEIGGFAGPQIG